MIAKIQRKSVKQYKEFKDEICAIALANGDPSVDP